MKNTLLEDNLGSIQHIGVPVYDLEESIIFYEKLGFKNVMSSNVVEEGGTIDVAMMQNGQTIMELYQLYGAERELLKSSLDGHINHIAFNVVDIDKAFSDIRYVGIPTIEEAPIFLNFWDKGCKYFTIRGPSGEKLEFNQILM